MTHPIPLTVGRWSSRPGSPPAPGSAIGGVRCVAAPPGDTDPAVAAGGAPPAFPLVLTAAGGAPAWRRTTTVLTVSTELDDAGTARVPGPGGLA